MMKRVLGKLKRAICARRFLGSGALLLLLSACGLTRCTPEPLPKEQFEALYRQPLSAPDAGLRVFHLGHSLVNRNMPKMIQAMAQAKGIEHRYESQLGWGTPLKSHWEPEEDIFGFDTENDHPRYRDVKEALGSGDYDAFVLTEMVEIKDAIDYFDSPQYLHNFAELARQGRPDIRVYLYETWHDVTDPEGWRNRLEKDRARYWEDGVMRPALAFEAEPKPIYVIPVGQVFAQIAREVEDGGLDGLNAVEELFARNDDGSLDPIHMGHLGNYISALTHFAVLYQKSPEGLSPQMQIFDENKAISVGSPELVAQLQRIVWQVVRSDPMTGVHAK